MMDKQSTCYFNIVPFLSLSRLKWTFGHCILVWPTIFSYDGPHPLSKKFYSMQIYKESGSHISTLVQMQSGYWLVYISIINNYNALLTEYTDYIYRVIVCRSNSSISSINEFLKNNVLIHVLFKGERNV